MEDFDVGVQCRSCLSATAAEYIDMESSMAGDYTFMDCFNICTNLAARTADELPVTICNGCSHDLQIAFDFVQVARQADAVLRENLAMDKELDRETAQQQIERLECIDSIETDTEEDVLALQDDEEPHMEIITTLDDEEEYREMETIEEQMLDDAIIEQEYYEEKPQLEPIVVELHRHNTRRAAARHELKEPVFKEEPQDLPDSYPEDEVDDEYLIEYQNLSDATQDNCNATQLVPQGPKWRCIECKRVLRGDVSYEGHMNMHKDTKPYKCTQCKSTFRCKFALERHGGKRHDTKTIQKCFSCDLCDKVFRLATLLLEHRRDEHKTLESCIKCNKSFKSKLLLAEHTSLIHPPSNTTPIQCPYCAQPALTKSRIAEHLRLHHPAEHRKHLHTVGRPCDENRVTPWQCEECFRYYRTEALLKDHRNIHTNERPHECTVCAKRFFTANNMRSHMRSMHQEEYEKRVAESQETIVQCDVCKKKLQKKNFEKHMMTHERKEKEAAEGTVKYLCAYCPQKFTKPKYLAMHEQGAHLLKQHDPQHTCPKCPKKFFQYKHLQAHMGRVHTQLRKHACDICGNAFKGRSQLSAHMKLHMEKNLRCLHCDKKYARHADLTVHMRSHTGELPYSCHLCDKSFAIKVRLTYHLQRHEGIKHPCPHCDAVYDNRNKLKDHMFKHTGMPYRCDECPGVEFSRRVRFINHMLRVHERTMTDDELAQMFAHNTGKVIRFKQLERNESGNSDFCDDSQQSKGFFELYEIEACSEEETRKTNFKDEIN